MNANDTNKKIKTFLPLLILFVVLIPVFANAQIIPCTDNCGFADLLKLVNNIINWIIMVSFPVAAGVFAWAGFKLMTTGVVDEKSAAKEMIRKVFIGFMAILAAWIIVTTITNTLLSDEFKDAVKIEGVK